MRENSGLFFCLARLVSFGAIFGFATLIASCTGLQGAYTSGVILEHQRQVMELEQRHRELANRVDGAQGLVAEGIRRIDDLGVRASGLGTSVLDIIELFALYQYAVEQLYLDFTNLQRALAGAE